MEKFRNGKYFLTDFSYSAIDETLESDALDLIDCGFGQSKLVGERMKLMGEDAGEVNPEMVSRVHG